jgi:hypothetical protein
MDREPPFSEENLPADIVRLALPTELALKPDYVLAGGSWSIK